MNVTVVLVVAFSAMLHAGWNFLSKTQKPSAAFFMLASSASVVVLSPLYFYMWPRYGQIPLEVWLLLIATGCAQGTYYIGLANAYRLNDISFVYPLARALPVLLVPAFCFLFGYGKPLSISALIGMLVIAVGCVVLPFGGRHTFRLGNYYHPSFLFIFVAAGGTTAYTIIDSIGLGILRREMRDFSPIEATLCYGSLQCLFVLVFLTLFVIVRREEQKTFREFRGKVLCFPATSGIICTIAYNLVLFAMQYAENVSYVVALRQLSILVGVLLGVLILREEKTYYKLVGVGCILSGLVVTAFN